MEVEELTVKTILCDICKSPQIEVKKFIEIDFKLYCLKCSKQLNYGWYR